MSEIRWLERLADWQETMSEAAATADDAYLAILGGDERVRGRFGEVLRPIRECSRRLREEVGDSPNPRFTGGYELVLRSCAHYEQFARALERSFDGDPGAALTDVEGEAAKADQLLLAAARQIESRLTANRRLPSTGGETGRSRVEPRLSRVAGVLAGKRVEVRCWSKGEWPRVVGEWGAYIGTKDIGAFAHPLDDRASLAPETCERLVGLTYRGERPARDDELDETAYAVGILAHETQHLISPVSSEAETECYGMQEIRRVARLLGASPRYGARLAEHYWRELYDEGPAEYRSSRCVNGGALDSAPESDVWP